MEGAVLSLRGKAQDAEQRLEQPDLPSLFRPALEALWRYHVDRFRVIGHFGVKECRLDVDLL